MCEDVPAMCRKTMTLDSQHLLVFCPQSIEQQSLLLRRDHGFFSKKKVEKVILLHLCLELELFFYYFYSQ